MSNLSEQISDLSNTAEIMDKKYITFYLIISLTIIFPAFLTAQHQSLPEKFLYECVIKEDTNGVRDDFKLRFGINQKKQTIVHLSSTYSTGRRRAYYDSKNILKWNLPESVSYYYYFGDWRSETTLNIKEGTYYSLQNRINYDYWTSGSCKIYDWEVFNERKII